MMKIGTSLCLTAAILLVAAPANAQLGGLKPKLPGMGGGSESSAEVSAGDIDAYIAKAQRNTEMLWLSYTLLKQAQKGKLDVAGLVAQRKELLAIQDPKERNSKMVALMEAEDASAKFNDQTAAELEKSIAAQSPAVRAQIGAALINLTIAIPRAVDLVKDAPRLIKGLGSSPSALGSVGKLKSAAGLLGAQVKYTADIAPLLPRLMSAAKAKPVADSQSSAGVPIPGFS